MKKKILTLICLIFCLCTAFSLGSACSDCEHVSVSDWIIDKQATCMQTGARHKECTSCKKPVEVETISMTGHDCVDDACKDCGKAIHLVFVENSDGESYSVSGLKENYETDIEVPSKYNGKPVTAIGVNCASRTGEGAFYGSNITSITIPNSVVKIYDGFENCELLTKTNFLGTVNEWVSIEFLWWEGMLPTACSRNLYINGELLTEAEITVSEIKECAFLGCLTIEQIRIADSVTTIGEAAFAGVGAEIIWGENPSVTEIGETVFAVYMGDSITIPDSVTTIGFGAFTASANITEIVIPDSVTSIGENAFYDCSSLQSVTIGNSVESIGYSAFEGCTSLTSIVLPNSLESIGSSAFYYCDSLTSIEIPNSVTSIGSSAFFGCSSLESIEVDKNNLNYQSIEGNLYSKSGAILIQYAIGKASNSFTVPSSVTSIGSSAFRGCTSLESITIGDSVESIGKWAFGNCSSLTSVVIPNSVTSIGFNAFEGCTSLTSIVLPNSLESIGTSAFYNCTSLTKVNYLGTIDGWVSIDFYDASSNPLANGADLYINNEKVTEAVITTATEIKDYAFYYYTSLTSVVIPNSVTSIGERAFHGCTSLKSITIGDSVESIGSSAFEGCTSLTSIVLPNSLESIGSSAFYNCSSLTSVIIPNSVTSIDFYAFEGCTSLTSIEIPNSVTSIGYSAFYGCTALTIYCEAESEPSGWNYWWNVSECPVVWGYDGE